MKAKGNIKMRISDILLLPRTVYKRITDGKLTLAAGILFVGAVDVLFGLIGNYGRFFLEKRGQDLAVNIVVAALMIILLGVVDVLFFAVPLYDLFKILPKVDDDNLKYTGMLPKIMKIYALAHIVIMPVNVVMLVLSTMAPPLSQSELFINALFIYFDILMPIWFAAVISRGINTVYSFQPLFRVLVFIVVYLWSYLEGYAVSFGGDWLINALLR